MFNSMCPFLLVYRVKQRLLLCEVCQYGVGIGLGYRQRLYVFIAKVKEVAVALLSEHADLADIDYVFPVASDKAAAFEAVLDRFKTATQHVLLEFALAVSVPDLDVVVVRLYVVEIVRIQ